MFKFGKEVFRWVYWYPFRYVVQQLPIKHLYILGRLISWLMAIFSSKAKALSDELLMIKKEIEPGSHEFKTIIRKSLFVYVCNEFEVLYFPKLNEKNIKDLIEYQGLRYLDQALSDGKGVVLLFAHFGANQMIMPALGHIGHTINQIAASPLVWKDIQPYGQCTFMQKKGMKIRWELEQALPTFFIDPFSSLKKAFQSIKKNEVIAITVDGGAGDNRFICDFFHQQVAFPIGSIDIAVRTGSPILPVFMVRKSNGYNTLIIEKPLSLPVLDNKREIINSGMRQFVHRLETYTKEHPDHYLNFLALRRLLSEKEGESFFQKN